MISRRLSLILITMTSRGKWELLEFRCSPRQSWSGHRPSTAWRPPSPCKALVFDNLGQKEVESASVLEIDCSVHGLIDNVEIGDTLLTNEQNCVNANEPLPQIAVERPNIRVRLLGVNKSPLSGREGKFLTYGMIRDRVCVQGA